MSILRINRFTARSGEADDLRQLVESFVPAIEGSQGCRSCRLLVDAEDPHRLVVLEEWNDVASHRAAVANIPREVFGRAMELLAEPPEGADYRWV